VGKQNIDLEILLAQTMMRRIQVIRTYRCCCCFFFYIRVGFVYFYVLEIFLKKIEFYLFFSLLQVNILLLFLDHFDALILKIIFKK